MIILMVSLSDSDALNLNRDQNVNETHKKKNKKQTKKCFLDLKKHPLYLILKSTELN